MGNTIHGWNVKRLWWENKKRMSGWRPREKKKEREREKEGITEGGREKERKKNWTPGVDTKRDQF